MSQYLVQYRRSTGDLLNFEDLGPDRAAAMARRLEEEMAHRDDPDIEVVLLTASSREALIRTHARYFQSVPELAAALVAALPGISGAATPHNSKDKLRVGQRKN